MTTFNEQEHPRTEGGQFTNKEGSAPEVGLEVQAPAIYEASELAGMTPEEMREAAQKNFDAHRAAGKSLAQAADDASNDALYPRAKEERQYRRAYSLYEGYVRTVFGDALRDEYANVTDEQHVKLFNRAWEDGHSEGYRRVEEEYAELADLFI